MKFATYALFDELLFRQVLFAGDVNGQQVVFVKLTKTRNQTVHVLLWICVLVTFVVGNSLGISKGVCVFQESVWGSEGEGVRVGEGRGAGGVVGGSASGGSTQSVHTGDHSFKKLLFIDFQHLVVNQEEHRHFADESRIVPPVGFV